MPNKSKEERYYRPRQYRYQQKRNAAIDLSLQQRLGFEIVLPESEFEYRALNRIDDLDFRAAVWRRALLFGGKESGIIRAMDELELEASDEQEKSQIDPMEIALETLSNLGPAYREALSSDDPQKIDAVNRLLAKVIALSHSRPELQKALGDLKRRLKEVSMDENC